MTQKNDSPPRQNVDIDGIEARLAELMKKAIAMRTEASLSQGQVAAKLGMATHSHIAAIETGRVVPRLDTFLKILSLYDCTIDVVKLNSKK